MRRTRRRAALVVALGACMAVVTSPSPALAVPPTATTGPPVTQSHDDGCNPDDLVTVTAGGTVDPGSADSTWYVEYGPTAAYGSQTTPQSAPAADGVIGVMTVLPPAAPGTLHYRVVASSANGPSTGTDEAVSTVAQDCPPPQVEAEVAFAQDDTSGPEFDFCAPGAGPDFFVNMTAAATPIESFSDPTLSTGSAAFEYGPTSAYGSVTPIVPVPWQARTASSIAIRVDNLTQTVHYALILTDPAGTTLVGPDTVQQLGLATCASKLGTTTTATIPWTLVRIKRGSRSIVIRYRPPCSVGAAIVGIVARRSGNRITVGVIATYTLDGPCTTRAAMVTKTVKLPATLRHRHLVHLITPATSVR
jgi:hypothetical protein